MEFALILRHRELFKILIATQKPTLGSGLATEGSVFCSAMQLSTAVCKLSNELDFAIPRNGPTSENQAKKFCCHVLYKAVS